MAISTNSKESGTARFIGSATAGVLELLGFHPVDTVAKRLMNNKTKVCIAECYSLMIPSLYSMLTLSIFNADAIYTQC